MRKWLKGALYTPPAVLDIRSRGFVICIFMKYFHAELTEECCEKYNDKYVHIIAASTIGQFLTIHPTALEGSHVMHVWPGA